MNKGLTEVAGIRVGHHTMAGRPTGCTVVLVDGEGAVGGVSQRGGAPGTRETDLLNPLNMVDRVNAIVLGGGSAFGLDCRAWRDPLPRGAQDRIQDRRRESSRSCRRRFCTTSSLVAMPKIRPERRLRLPRRRRCQRRRRAGGQRRRRRGRHGRQDGRSRRVSRISPAPAFANEGRRRFGGDRVAERPGRRRDRRGQRGGDVIDPLVGAGRRRSTQPRRHLADVRKLLVAGALAPRTKPAENTTIGLVATNARLTKEQATPHRADGRRRPRARDQSVAHAR